MKNTHFELFQALANGEALSNWECQHVTWGPVVREVDPSMLQFIVKSPDEWQFRRRQKYISMGGIKVPKPLTSVPPVGTTVYVVDTLYLIPNAMVWSGHQDYQFAALGAGMLHSTEQDAKEHLEAIVLLSGGKQENDKQTPTL